MPVPEKDLNLFNKILALLSRRVGDLGLIVLMAMVLLVVYDVASRRLFNRPLSFSFELIEILLVAVVFFALVYTTSLQRHISVDVLTSRFPPKVQTIINRATDFITVVIFGLIGWRSLIQAAHIRDIGNVTGVLRIPVYPFNYVVAFGSIIAALLILVSLINSMIGAAKK